MVDNALPQSPSENRPVVGFVTAPSVEVARLLANSLLEKESVTCVNLIPGVESVYRWDGKVQSDQEILMMVKTMTSAQRSVIETIAAEHPYDVPECIFIEVTEGHSPYLSWLNQEVRKT